jgi:Zn-dependent peptidase ImmA (M78 family)
VKRRLRRLAGRRWTKEGAVVIQVSEERSQARNREIARERLAELVKRATVVPKKRRPTKPTRGSVERRIKAKKVRGEVKAVEGEKRWRSDAGLITRDLAFRPTDRIEEIAAEVRTYLGVTMEQQFSWGNAETALEEWRKVLLGVGVYVFKDQFREPDYSGFCLYDDEFPIIYVNNTTAKTRQIFTLFHELAHLLFHTSGVDRTGDGFVDELAGDDRRIEIICNRMAACLLVPEKTFDEIFASKPPTEATALELAQLFS